MRECAYCGYTHKDSMVIYCSNCKRFIGNGSTFMKSCLTCGDIVYVGMEVHINDNGDIISCKKCEGDIKYKTVDGGDKFRRIIKT